jgi:hypothetical protein
MAGILLFRSNTVAFEGYLSGLQLQDLLQLASGSRKTGMYRFRGRDGGRGRVYFYQGQVVHAESEEGGTVVEGETALGLLALWDGGRFEFVPGAVTGKKTITRGITTILLEAARRRDEAMMRR